MCVRERGREREVYHYALSERERVKTNEESQKASHMKRVYNKRNVLRFDLRSITVVLPSSISTGFLWGPSLNIHTPLVSCSNTPNLSQLLFFLMLVLLVLLVLLVWVL